MSVRKIKGYRIIQEVGRGRKAALYFAHNPKTGGKVRIRLLDPGAFPVGTSDSLVNAYFHAADSLRRMAHPHLARILDIGEFQGSPFLVTEAGAEMAFAALPTPIPAATAVRLLRSAAEALDFLTANGFAIPRMSLADWALSSTEHVALIGFAIEEWLAKERLACPSNYLHLALLFYELITGETATLRQSYRAGLTIRDPRQLVQGLPEPAAAFFVNAFSGADDAAHRSGSAFIMAAERLIGEMNAARRIEPDEKAALVHDLDAELRMEPIEPESEHAADTAGTVDEPMPEAGESEPDSEAAPVQPAPEPDAGHETVDESMPEAVVPEPDPKAASVQPASEPDDSGHTSTPIADMPSEITESDAPMAKKRAGKLGWFLFVVLFCMSAMYLLNRFALSKWTRAGLSLPDQIQALPSMALGTICEGLVNDALMTAAADRGTAPVADEGEAMPMVAMTAELTPTIPTVTPSASPSMITTPTATATVTMTASMTMTASVTREVTATPDLPRANELILSVLVSDSKEDYAYVKNRLDLVDEHVQFAASGLEGELKHATNGYIEEFSTDAMKTLKNFFLEVDFLNPYDASFHDFDFGIIFRDEGNKNNQYRISMDSDGVWAFQDNRDQTTGTLVDSGYLPTFNRLAGEVNSVLLIVQNDRALFYFNEAYVKELNLEERDIVGKVAIGTGFFSGDEVEGYSSGYRNLAVRDLGELELQLFDPIPCDPWGEIEIIRAYGNPLTSVQKTNGIAELAITGGMIVIEPPLAAQAYDWEAVVEPDHFNKKPVRRECEWIGARVHCGPFRWIRPVGGTPYLFRIYRRDSSCLVSEVMLDNAYFKQVWDLLR